MKYFRATIFIDERRYRCGFACWMFAFRRYEAIFDRNFGDKKTTVFIDEVSKKAYKKLMPLKETLRLLNYPDAE